MRMFNLFNVMLLLLIASVVILISPSHLFALINLPGMIVVFGGSCIALMLSKPQQKVFALFNELPQAIKGSTHSYNALREFQQILRFAHLFRSSKFRAIEKEIQFVQQPLLNKGMQLLLDRCSAEDLKQILRKEIAKLLTANHEKVQMLRLMASYAPAFGMFGTLLGMIHMLYGLGDEGLNEMGATMGFAMLTTLYGLVLANLVCKPLALKLERQDAEFVAHLEVLVEGLMMVHEKKHPLIIRDMFTAHGVSAEKKVVKVPSLKHRFSKLFPLAAAQVD